MINPDKATRNLARSLRKRLSPPEAKLWVQLGALRPAGLHFRRQVPMLGYYLDFACLSRRIAVEVDGGHHAYRDQRRHDVRRDTALRQVGFLVLRYPARDVFQNLEGVVEGIIEIANGRPVAWGRAASDPDLPHPALRARPPLKGEGRKPP